MIFDWKIVVLLPALFKLSYTKGCIDTVNDCAYNGFPVCKSAETAKTDFNTGLGLLTKTKTVNDIPCQMWMSQTPHEHNVKPELGNFCSNPGRRFGPWCYTTDPRIRWQYCYTTCGEKGCVDLERDCAKNRFPECTYQETATLDVNGKSVVRERTRSGKPCAKWSHEPLDWSHEDLENLKNYDGNDCKNPNSQIGSWCYLDGESQSEGMGWDFCYDSCSINGCINSAENCAYIGSPECKSPYLGFEDESGNYVGRQTKTASGRPCMKWADLEIGDEYNKYYENDCITINAEGPWCYTPDMDWEYCWKNCSHRGGCINSEQNCAYNGSPTCKSSDLEFKNELGKDVTKNETESGRPCRKWTDGDHQYNENYGNECMVHDKEGPFCYTTDTNNPWEYCYKTCGKKETSTPPPPTTTTTTKSTTTKSTAKPTRKAKPKLTTLDPNIPRAEDPRRLKKEQCDLYCCKNKYSREGLICDFSNSKSKKNKQNQDWKLGCLCFKKFPEAKVVLDRCGYKGGEKIEFGNIKMLNANDTCKPLIKKFKKCVDKDILEYWYVACLYDLCPPKPSPSVDYNTRGKKLWGPWCLAMEKLEAQCLKAKPNSKKTWKTKKYCRGK